MTMTGWTKIGGNAFPCDETARAAYEVEAGCQSQSREINIALAVHNFYPA
jgi:hypothetical protein